MEDDNIKIKEGTLVRGIFCFPSTTTHSVGVKLFGDINDIKSQEHFREKYMIKEMGQIVYYHQELSWTLLVASVEALGRYVSENKDSFSLEDKQNQKYFRDGLRLLGNKYDKYNGEMGNHKKNKLDLYNFRNNVAHCAFFSSPFSASEKIGGPSHLSVNNGLLNLVAEDFYEDLKSAWEKAKPPHKKFQIKSVNVEDNL